MTRPVPKYLTGIEIGPKFIHYPARLSTVGAWARMTDAEYAASWIGPKWGYDRTNTPWHRYMTAPYQDARGFPQDLQDDAAKFGRELVFAFQTFRSRLVRDRSHGSLDSSKLARLASPGISARQFDRLAGSAFKHRERAPVETTKPRVAIVCDMAWEKRSADDTYCPRAARLAATVAEAAQIAGVETQLLLSRGNASSGFAKHIRAMAGRAGAGHALHCPIIAKDWHETFEPGLYAVASSSMSFIGTLEGYTEGGHSEGLHSHDGGGAVEYARMHGAQLVVALGDFYGDAAPDYRFPITASVAEVVRAIVAHVTGRKDAA